MGMLHSEAGNIFKPKQPQWTFKPRSHAEESNRMNTRSKAMSPMELARTIFTPGKRTPKDNKISNQGMTSAVGWISTTGRARNPATASAKS